MRSFSARGPVCKATPSTQRSPLPAPARLNHEEPNFLSASFFFSLVFKILGSRFFVTPAQSCNSFLVFFTFFLSFETDFSKRRKTLKSSVWILTLAPAWPVACTSYFSPSFPFLQVGWKCLYWQGAGKSKWEHLWAWCGAVNTSLPSPQAFRLAWHLGVLRIDFHVKRE